MATAVPSNFNVTASSFDGVGRYRGADPAPAAAGDDLDDLFDYDAGMEELLRGADATIEAPGSNAPSGARGGQGSGARDALGIDEEIQITRKPRINVKLDEKRLLSQAGIPKLRRISKERLRFKGKGHEYGDIARLLSVYQLWLDDLYPKAKFADGLSIIEKLGHTKRMQTMRREWIEEGKPRSTVEDDVDDAVPAAEASDHGREQTRDDSDVQVVEAGTAVVPRPRTPSPNAVDFDDLYDATPRTQRVTAAATNQGASADARDLEQPEEDELDALLAEDAAAEAVGSKPARPIPVGQPTQKSARDEFEDEMEAMAEMDGMW